MVCTDEEGNIAYSVTNSYTSDGLLDTKTTDWGDSISWERYTYDDQGNVLSFQSGNEDEIWADDVYKNTYDNGKLVDVQTYQDDVLRWNEQYDADGNLVLAVNYEYNGSESSRDVYTYENGRLLLRVSFFNGEEILRHEYTYNDAGQLTKLSYFDKGELYSSQIYLYEDSSLVGVKLYTQEELEATYILSYETADVTNAQAKKLQALYDAFLDI